MPLWLSLINTQTRGRLVNFLAARAIYHIKYLYLLIPHSLASYVHRVTPTALSENLIKPTQGWENYLKPDIELKP